MEICDKPTAAQRRAAYREFKRAVRAGELVPATVCDWCGATARKIHGHHPDYARPMMVVWICSQCHGQHHAQYAIERRLFRTLPKKMDCG